MSTITPRPPASPRPAPMRPVKAVPSKLTPNIDPIRVLRRHVFLLVMTFVIGAILGTGVWFLLDQFAPQYSSTVLFEVRPGLRGGSEFGTAESANDDEIARIALTEGVLILSRGVLEDALKNPVVRQTDWSKKYLDSTGTIDVDSAIDALSEELKSSLIRGSNLFDLRWATRNKADTAEVLNAVARSYLSTRKDIEHSTYDTNLALFRTRQNQTAREIEDLAQEMQGFIREKGIMTLGDPRDSPVAAELRSLNSSLAANVAGLNMGRTQFNQTAAKLRGTLEPSAEDVLMSEKDPMVAPHNRALLDIKTALQEMKGKFSPDHFAIRAMENRYRATEIERDAKRDEIIQRNLEARLKIIQDQLETLQRVIEETEKDVEEKSEMMRELAASQTRFDSLATRRRHLEAQRDSDIQLIQEVNLLKLRSDATRVRRAQWAETPRGKSFPKWQMIIPLGAMVMFLLTLGIVFLREFMDQRVKSASDLDVLPNAEVLASIPELGEDPTGADEVELVVRKHPQSVLAEGYRQATMPICRSIDHAGIQTILFVGGMPGSGATTAMSNVAATLHATGKSVVVVDANFRRPRLAQAMDVPTDRQGLGDVLCGDAELRDVLLQSSCGVMVISAGTPGNRLFERLGAEVFDHLIAQLRADFDVVLVDTPPAVVAGDAVMLANKLDAAVLIVRASREQRGLVARLINQFTDARAQLLGVMLNRPRGIAGGYFKKNYEAMAEYAAKSAT